MSVGRAVVRHARASDAEDIARVHAASADDSLAPLAREWPALALDRRSQQWASLLGAANRTNLVATLADHVVGFIGGGPPRKQDMPAGFEIYVVHVLPAHRGQGIGGQLWDVACTALRGPAHAPLCLETLAELPCCSFYEARGGEVGVGVPTAVPSPRGRAEVNGSELMRGFSAEGAPGRSRWL